MVDHLSLPEDAILEILSRLPVKSLARFKTVSKSWHALITDPRFIIRHLISKNNHESLLISHLHPVNWQVLSSLSLSSETLAIESKSFQLSYAEPNAETRRNAQILGPCNGVFCLFDSKDSISLWNPATRNLKFLPQSYVETPPGTFAFDICVGFGFDARNNDYKVLKYKHMCFPSSVTIAHAEVYSLKTNQWREVDVGEEFQPTGNLPLSPCNPYIDGVFSWFDIDNHVEKVIFSFDMKDEVFMKTQLPDYDGIPSKMVHGCLASLRNSLAFIHDYPLGGISKSFDVWVLGEYGVRESWTKQLSVGPILGVRAPLAFWRSGELLFEDARGKLLSYDPITQDMKEVRARAVENIMQVVPYKESLVCLHRGDGESEQDMDETPFSLCECEDDV